MGAATAAPLVLGPLIAVLAGVGVAALVESGLASSCDRSRGGIAASDRVSPLSRVVGQAGSFPGTRKGA